MNLAGIILAAGESRRMGRPKALLPFCGETFLDRMIATLSLACSPVLVVLGHEPEAVRRGVSRAGEARFVTNAAYRNGQLSSLQCGLRALPYEAGGVLFTPVDCPGVTAETILRIAAALAGTDAPLVLPRYNGRRGHPVGITRLVIAELLALPENASARDVIHARLDQALQLDLDDPGVLQDIDTPEAYQRLIGGGAP